MATVVEGRACRVRAASHLRLTALICVVAPVQFQAEEFHLRRPVRIILAAVATIAVILIIAVAGIFWYVDSLARRGIEAGGTYALGVDTTVRSVNVGLLGGTVAVDGLHIANPQGFQSPTFMAIEDGRTTVSVRTLRHKVIRVPQLHLSDLSVHLERHADGRANYRVILDSIERLSRPDTPQRAPDGPERRLIIGDLVIRNITVHAAIAAPGVLGELAPDLTGRGIGGAVTIPEIRLTDVGQTGEGVAGTGVTMAELAGLIVEAILAAAIQHGGDILPADLLGDLRGRLAQLGNIERLTGTIDELGRKLHLPGAAEEIGDAVRRGRDELREMIPRRDRR
jgi:hypothetical protein